MSYPIYMVPAGDVLPIFFSTFDGGTGASITMTGLAVTDIEIYKDGGTTQRASDAGYTLLDTDGIDFDAITGIHGFSIDTGDNTDASFYTTGSWFHVVVSSVTVDAQTVNFIAAAFRIMAAETVAAVPKVDVSTWDGTDVTTGVPLAPTTAGRTLDVDASGGCEVGSFQTGAIGATAFAAGAIEAAGIAADAIGSSELAATAATEIADALLARNVAGGSSTGRTVTQALYALRNRTVISGGTLTVYQTDDSTAEWTAAVTTSAGDPISEINPS